MLFISGKEIAELSQDDPDDDIRDDMLLHGQCGDTYGNRCQQGSILIPAGNSRIVSHSDPAQPAYKTVNGRHEIVRAVHPVDKHEQLIENGTSRSFRARDCRRQQNKEQKTEEFADKMRKDETDTAALVKYGGQAVIDNPEQIGSAIDHDGPRYKRNNVINRQGKADMW